MPEPEGINPARASISAIIPVFNNRDMVADAIASVQAQTRSVVEVIVADDASTDDSADVAAASGARVVRLPENRGASAARNAALQVASGEFVAFLDADDTWAPSHCALLAEQLDRHPGVALVSSRTQRISPIDSSPYSPPLGQPFDALHYLVRDNFVTQSAALVRRSALDEAGGYDERLRFSEDYDLWLRIALRHPMIALPDVTVMRRLHPGQVTWKNMAPLYSAKWQLRLGLLDAPEVVADPGRRARVEEALRQSVEIDFGFTWRDLDATSFALVDAAAKQVPAAALIRNRWRLKRLLLWHVWISAVRLRRALRRRTAQATVEQFA